MKSPILSICIPTYNRSEYLQKCLQSIEIQLEEKPHLQNLVEIVISDNHSTDTTKEVVDEFIHKFSHIKYVVNEKNVGFDLNILNVVKNASGDYCWYLGDDDIIINGALSFVCEIIFAHKYDIICIEAEHLTDQKEYLVERKFLLNDTVTIKDSDEYYFKGYCQGGVSVLMFKRSLWLSLVDENNFLEHWLYYETVLRVLAVSDKEKLYIKKAGIQTGQDCRWAENGGELFTFVNSNMLLEKMISFGFDKQRIERELQKNSKKIIIILLRAKGHDLVCTIKNLKYIYNNLSRVSISRLFLVTLIYFLPNILIKLIRDIKKRISKVLK